MNRLLYISLFLHCFLALKGSDLCVQENESLQLDSIRTLIIESQTKQVVSYAQDYLSIENTPSPDGCESSLWIKYYIGLAQQELRVYEDALTTLYDVILIAKKNNHPEIEAESYLTIALVYEFLQNQTKCLENLNKAEEVIKKHDIKESYPRFCVRSSSYYRYNNNNQKAKHYAKEATIHAPKVNDINNEVDGYLLLGHLSSNYVESIKHFEKAVELSLSVKKYITAATQSLNSAVVLSKNNKYKSANKYLNKSYSILQKLEERNKDYYSIVSYYHLKKKELFVSENMLDSALYHAEHYASTRYKAYTQTNTDALEAKEINFQNELEKQKADQVLKIARLQSIALYIGSFLLLFLCSLAYLLNKKRKQVKKNNQFISDQNVVLTKEKEKSEMLLSEIHHRVKNNLQNIVSLILFKKIESKTRNEKAILNDINSKIMSLAMTYENLYTSGKFNDVDVIAYLDQFTTNYRLSNNSNIKFTTQTNKNHLNIETMIPIGLLLSELCAIPQSWLQTMIEGLSIHISINEDADSNLTLVFKQIGKLYSKDIIEESNNSSNISIIKSMCRQLNGKYRFYNTEDGCFEFRFSEKVISKV